MRDFSEVKVGDEVGVTFSGHNYHLKKVDRVTSTLIIIGEHRFRKSDGNETGEWNSGRIFPLDEAKGIIAYHLEQNRKHELVSILHEKYWAVATLEDLEAFAALTEDIPSRSQVNVKIAY